MNTEILSKGDVLFVRSIKKLGITLKRLKRVYGIVFDVSTEYVEYKDLAWYLNDFVFKFNLITPQAYHEKMTKFMFWEEYKFWFRDDNITLTLKDVYILSTIALCCNIIGGTPIVKLPGYIRRKVKS